MPLFDDINLPTIFHEDELYINVKDLAWHIVDTMDYLYAENTKDIKGNRISSEDQHYFFGMMQGMNSVVILLSQGGLEEELNEKVNSVEDLLNYIKDSND